MGWRRAAEVFGEGFWFGPGDGRVGSSLDPRACDQSQASADHSLALDRRLAPSQSRHLCRSHRPQPAWFHSSGLGRRTIEVRSQRASRRPFALEGRGRLTSLVRVHSGRKGAIRPLISSWLAEDPARGPRSRCCLPRDHFATLIINMPLWKCTWLVGKRFSRSLLRHLTQASPNFGGIRATAGWPHPRSPVAESPSNNHAAFIWSVADLLRGTTSSPSTAR